MTHIAFEGVDGSGKTTLCDAVGKALDPQRFQVIHNPGSSGPGSLLRDAFAGRICLPRRALHYLFLADAVVAQETIQAYKTATIIQDRLSYLSGWVYWQEDLSRAEAEALLNTLLVTEFPEHIFFLQVNPATLMARLKARGGLDRVYEAGASASKWDRLQRRYQQVGWSKFASIFQVLDGNLPVETLVKQVLAIVRPGVTPSSPPAPSASEFIPSDA